nr:MAG TPA: hypothetical protein [Caudoviricetes sp.]
MPNRLTGAPYLALLSNYAIHAYLICLTHIPKFALFFHPRPTFHVGYAVSLACLSHEQC